MCGIFGVVGGSVKTKRNLKVLSEASRRRGSDSSGLVAINQRNMDIYRADYDIRGLWKKINLSWEQLAFGHSRLITNGLKDNQPVVNDDVILVHNGIIINKEEIAEHTHYSPKLEVDSEALSMLISFGIKNNLDTYEILDLIDEKVLGSVSMAAFIISRSELVFYSNTGSLYTGFLDDDLYFASERGHLQKMSAKSIVQVTNGKVISLDQVEISTDTVNIFDYQEDRIDLIPSINYADAGDKFVVFDLPKMRRCSKCILPETMPFINFDELGVCNYCNNYTSKNGVLPKDEFQQLVNSYRRAGQSDVLIPFSGGRDSSYGLHVVVNELKMRPITYTYDWGMVTDLARRNISRMCSQLGIENIVVAADITKKRKNIRKNLLAWLEAPNLGLMSLLTAGDKHFFRYIKRIQHETGITLNLWSVNPLEVTHFKTGFLGVPPHFAQGAVYNSGISKQLLYHKKRFSHMSKTRKFFNSSLFDTLSGEYYRSIAPKTDYFHIFDYYPWQESEVDGVLLNEYDWELAPDSRSTWRIGDGTAAFYNYVYHTIAGFTEHDTFRSNQIREGHITRSEALDLVHEENRPRYPNIKWYLETLNLDPEAVLGRINGMERLYEKYL